MIAQRAANFFISEGECPMLLHAFTNVPSDDELFISFVDFVILSHTYVHTHKLMSRSFVCYSCVPHSVHSVVTNNGVYELLLALQFEVVYCDDVQLC